MYRIIIVLTILLSLVSCDFFNKREKLNQEETIIDYTKVDVSPAPKKCKKYIDEKRTACFRKYMKNKVKKIFKHYTDTISSSVTESFTMIIEIDKKGKASFVNLKISDQEDESLLDLGKYLRKAISKIPKFEPAIKRGIPVTARYKIPVVVKN